MQLSLFADPAPVAIDRPAAPARPAPVAPFQPIDEIGQAMARRKSRQSFYTPLDLVQFMVEDARIWPGARVLEPSAGDGRIIHAMRQAGAVDVDACEIDPASYDRCAELGAKMVARDFLTYRPGPIYWAIVMNPPFTGGQAKKHIEHAYSLLAPGGRLITIAPSSLAGDFATCGLDLPACTHATYENLAPDRFKESGASASTILAWIDGPGEDSPSYGFSNHSTGQAAVAIDSTFELYELSRRAFAPGLADNRAIDLRRDFRRRACEYLATNGASCYGINWPELFSYFAQECAGGDR